MDHQKCRHGDRPQVCLGHAATVINGRQDMGQKPVEFTAEIRNLVTHSCRPSKQVTASILTVAGFHDFSAIDAGTRFQRPGPRTAYDLTRRLRSIMDLLPWPGR
jgi:hypothetical protein